MHLQYINPTTIDAIVNQNSQAYRYAVARAVASVLPVSAAPVDSPAVYFADIHTEMAEKIVGTFNEAKPLDFDAAMNEVKVFWLVRYGTVHDAADDFIVEGNLIKPSLLDLFGATTYMPFDMRDYLVDNYQQVLATLGLCIKAARKMHAAFAGA